MVLGWDYMDGCIESHQEMGKWIGLISYSYSAPHKMFVSLGMEKFLTYPSSSGYRSGLEINDCPLV